MQPKNSKIVFIDENENILHTDNVFNINILTGNGATTQSTNHAVSGDEVAIYVKVDNYETEIINLIRECKYIISEK